MQLISHKLLAILLVSVPLVSLVAIARVEALQSNVQDTLPALIEDEPSSEAPKAVTAPAKSDKEAQESPSVISPTLGSSPELAKQQPPLPEAADPTTTAASSAQSATTELSGSTQRVAPLPDDQRLEGKKIADEKSGAEKPEVKSKELATSQSNEQASPSSSATGPIETVKDINTLLANKNDAENDVVASSSTQNTIPTTTVTLTDTKTGLAIDLDAPVDTNKPVDDRFHYSIGNNQDKPATSDEFGAKPAEEPTTEKPPQVVEENDPKPGKLEPTATESAYPAPVPKVDEPKVEHPATKAAPETPTQEESKLDGKPMNRVDDKTKSIVVEMAPDNDANESSKKMPTTEASSEGKKETDKPPAGVPETPSAPATSSSPTPPPTTTTTTTTPTTTTTTTSRPPVEKSTSQQAEKEQEEEKPVSEPKDKKVTIDSIGSPSTTEGPASKQQPLAGVEAALGAATALGTVLVSKKSNKDELGTSKPISTAEKSQPKAENPTSGVPKDAAPTTASSSSSSTTTTKAPAQRKSTTDRWNRWSTPASPPVVLGSSTTLVPTPARRRPILPSIRRRFRPYNRFSPFPWGGADSYSPIGGPNDPDYLPETDESGYSSQGSGSKRTSYSPTSTTSTPNKPAKRRNSSSTTSTEAPVDLPASKLPKGNSNSKPPSTTRPTDEDRAEDENEPPTFASRRRVPSEPESGGRRQHHHHHNRHHDRDNDNYGPSHRRRHQAHGHRFNHERDDTGARPPFGGSGFDLFNGQDSLSPFGRPTGGFGLFNSGSSSSSGAGSGFDLLNPFSWLDEVTRPRPSILNRPGSFESRPSLGAASGGSPTFGSPARLPGHRPIPVEGEYSSGGVGHANEPVRPQHHGHHEPDHHNQGNRRPITGGHGRDDYDDYHGHDCHHEHDRDRDNDHPNHNHRPHRPYRPHREPFGESGRPSVGGPDYDNYGGGYNSRPRPNRPYHERRDGGEGSSTSGSGSASSPERESTNSNTDNGGYSPASSSRPSSSNERIHGGNNKPDFSNGSSSSSSSPVAARRIPSVFSPFDSLFGPLDDDLFGGLRSSFIDSPLKATAAASPSDTNTAFDAVISSPKIRMPSAAPPVATDSAATRPKPTVSIERFSNLKAIEA